MARRRIRPGFIGLNLLNFGQAHIMRYLPPDAVSPQEWPRFMTPFDDFDEAGQYDDTMPTTTYDAPPSPRSQSMPDAPPSRNRRTAPPERRQTDSRAPRPTPNPTTPSPNAGTRPQQPVQRRPVAPPSQIADDMDSLTPRKKTPPDLLRILQAHEQRRTEEPFNDADTDTPARGDNPTIQRRAEPASGDNQPPDRSTKPTRPMRGVVEEITPHSRPAAPINLAPQDTGDLFDDMPTDEMDAPADVVRAWHETDDTRPIPADELPSLPAETDSDAPPVQPIGRNTDTTPSQPAPIQRQPDQPAKTSAPSVTESMGPELSEPTTANAAPDAHPPAQEQPVADFSSVQDADTPQNDPVDDPSISWQPDWYQRSEVYSVVNHFDAHYETSDDTAHTSDPTDSIQRSPDAPANAPTPEDSSTDFADDEMQADFQEEYEEYDDLPVNGNGTHSPHVSRSAVPDDPVDALRAAMDAIEPDQDRAGMDLPRFSMDEGAFSATERVDYDAYIPPRLTGRSEFMPPATPIQRYSDEDDYDWQPTPDNHRQDTYAQSDPDQLSLAPSDDHPTEAPARYRDPVDTDLLRLINMPPDTPIIGRRADPPSPEAQRPTFSHPPSMTSRPADTDDEPDSSIQWHDVPLDEAIMRQLAEPTQADDNNDDRQTDVDEDEPDDQDDQDIDGLAREVYRRLRRQLRIENERRTGRSE